MNNDNPFIRIGTSYYKSVSKPTINGELNESLVSWTYEIIVRDLKEKQVDVTNFIKDIPKYEGMTCIPNHINYQRVYGTFYNTYAPLEHTPRNGESPQTLNYLKHIFGSQLELALDYFKLLYEKPTQILPILCLVSEKRETGKTTLLKWLKMIYGTNMSFLDNQVIAGRFNSDFTGKLIGGVEEASIQNEWIIDILKNMSTADRINSEAKGKDRVEVDMFLKIILCSNKEVGLVKIDEEETRFWIVKYPEIKKTDRNINLLEKMNHEIPACLHYLQNREMFVEKPLSRMWFSPQQLETQALRKMKLASRGSLELELATTLYTAMEDLDLTEIHLTPTDALYVMGKPKSNLLSIRRILKNDWKLVPQINSNSYSRLLINDFGYHLNEGAKGRYFTITKSFIHSHFDELMN